MVQVLKEHKAERVQVIEEHKGRRRDRCLGQRNMRRGQFHLSGMGG